MAHNSGNPNSNSHSYTSRRSLGVDSTLVLRFIATSFAYLLAGLVFFLFAMLGIMNLERDAIFVLWLFGFVAMIIFGLSYMFSSGLSRSSAFMNSTVKKEYVLLNIGVIAFFLGFSGAIPVIYGKPVALFGLIAIMVSVSLHLMNLVLVATTRKTTNVEKQTFQDNY